MPSFVASECFTRPWIDRQRSVLEGGDPTLIEKAVLALALAVELAGRQVPFVFKGGTSLLLRMPVIRRLSIDVDILCTLPDAELDQVLREISRVPPFAGCEEDLRDMARLPARRHFKFHYLPLDPSNQAPFVILDVVKEPSPYPNTQIVPIRSVLVELESPVNVALPTVEGMLGDKLTAFAPDTVGVPCAAATAMQVMKQVFDIGELFNLAENAEEVERTYTAVFRAENRYRDNRFTRVEALEDTLRTSRLICCLGLRGGEQNQRTKLLDQGRLRIQSHLTGAKFAYPEMKTAAAKAAALAACLKAPSPARSLVNLRFDQGRIGALKAVRLADPVLNRLKGSNPEAFYYWRVVENLGVG